MDWITDNIAIGNFADAEPADRSEIDAILCLRANCCDENDVRFWVCCVPLVDGTGNAVTQIERALDFMHSVVGDGERILVHCHAGRSRSTAIVAKYLMVSWGMSQDQALSHIGQKREIYLSPGIAEILESRQALKLPSGNAK